MTDSINNMDDLKDDYTEWRKGQDKKKWICLCDQIYIKFNLKNAVQYIKYRQTLFDSTYTGQLE